MANACGTAHPALVGTDAIGCRTYSNPQVQYAQSAALLNVTLGYNTGSLSHDHCTCLAANLTVFYSLRRDTSEFAGYAREAAK